MNFHEDLVVRTHARFRDTRDPQVRASLVHEVHASDLEVEFAILLIVETRCPCFFVEVLQGLLYPTSRGVGAIEITCVLDERVAIDSDPQFEHVVEARGDQRRTA